MFIRSLLIIAMTGLPLLNAAPKKTKDQKTTAKMHLSTPLQFRAEDYFPSEALAAEASALLNQCKIDTSNDSLEVIAHKLENFDSTNYRAVTRSTSSCPTAKGDELTRLELFLKPAVGSGATYSLVFRGLTPFPALGTEGPLDQLKDELNAFKQYEQIIAKNSLKLMKAPKVSLLHLKGKPQDVKAGNYALILEHTVVGRGLEYWDSIDDSVFGDSLSLELAAELVIVLEQMLQAGYVLEALTTDGNSISFSRWNNFSRTLASGVMSKAMAQDIAQETKKLCSQVFEQDPVYGKITCCMMGYFLQQKFEKFGLIAANLELLQGLTDLVRQSKSEVQIILNSLRSRLVHNLVPLVNGITHHDIEAALRKVLSNCLTAPEVKTLSAAVTQGLKTPVTAEIMLQWLDKEVEASNDQSDTGTN